MLATIDQRYYTGRRAVHKDAGGIIWAETCSCFICGNYCPAKRAHYLLGQINMTSLHLSLPFQLSIGSLAKTTSSKMDRPTAYLMDHTCLNCTRASAQTAEPIFFITCYKQIQWSADSVKEYNSISMVAIVPEDSVANNNGKFCRTSMA